MIRTLLALMSTIAVLSSPVFAASSCCAPDASCCTSKQACCNTNGRANSKQETHPKSASVQQLSSKESGSVTFATKPQLETKTAVPSCCETGSACCYPAAACCK